MISVEGYKGLYRDENSNAIINCDDSQFNSYMMLKNKLTTEKEEINHLKNEIEELKLLIKKISNDKD